MSWTMAKHKINQYITINGVKHWISASTAQEFADKVIALSGTAPAAQAQKHPFDEYAWNWFNTYSKPTVATVTATTYKRQLRAYLVPAFQGLAVEDIGPDEVQRLFNSMSAPGENYRQGKQGHTALHRGTNALFDSAHRGHSKPH